MTSQDLLLRHVQMRLVSSSTKTTRYETLCAPFPATSLSPNFAFGGLSVALAVQAAFHSIHATMSSSSSTNAKQWNIQSIQGSFLGPLTVKACVQIDVDDVRNTRQYQTRIVRIVQVDENRQEQVRVVFLVDFCRGESEHFRHTVTGDALEYCRPPKNDKTLKLGPEGCLGLEQICHRAKEQGLDKTAIRFYVASFDTCERLCESRFAPSHQDMNRKMGLAPLSKEQIRQIPGGGKDGTKIVDHLWYKSHAKLDDVDAMNKQANALPIGKHTLGFTSVALNLDPRIPGLFSSAHHLKIGYDVYCVTMDCSVHFHTARLDAEAWYMNECELDVAGHARYEGQARTFDRHGKLVATCRQLCSVVDLGAARTAEKKARDTKM